MSTKYRRNEIFHINSLQVRILYPILISCFVTTLMIMLCIVCIYNPELIFERYDDDRIQNLMPWFLLSCALILMTVVFWAYRISNKLVGAYDRVVRELDEILAGKRKGPLGARKGDVLFLELLKRINALISKLH